MHQGCASEQTLNPAHSPSLWVCPSHFLSFSPPPRHTTPCHLALSHPSLAPLSFSPLSFLPLHTKTGWRAPFSSRLPSATGALETPWNTHTHNHGHLKFKGTASLVSCCCVLHLKPQTTTTCSVSFSFSPASVSLSFQSFFQESNSELHSCRQQFYWESCFLLDYWSMECVCVCVFADEHIPFLSGGEKFFPWGL